MQKTNLIRSQLYSQFNYSGFAALGDLKTNHWSEAFQALEEKHLKFRSLEENFLTDNYIWPRDCLYAPTRIWEYPYVYENVKNCLNGFELERPKVCDYGSGVTFFPFAVANLGCDVTCIDIDPVCVDGINNANKVIETGSGKANALLLQDGKIPLSDASQDIIYCISVIEHIPERAIVIKEFDRILKPGGKIIFTFDVDLRGNFEIGPEGFRDLLSYFDKYFVMRKPNRPLHPLDILSTQNSPYSFSPRRLLSVLFKTIKNYKKTSLRFSEAGPDMNIAVYSAVMEKPYLET